MVYWLPGLSSYDSYNWIPYFKVGSKKIKNKKTAKELGLKFKPFEKRDF